MICYCLSSFLKIYRKLCYNISRSHEISRTSLFIKLFSDSAEFFGHSYVHKTANDFFSRNLCLSWNNSFHLILESFHWFEINPWSIEMIADFIILVLWLWIFITRANLKNGVLNQVIAYKWKSLKKVSI